MNKWILLTLMSLSLTGCYSDDFCKGYDDGWNELDPPGFFSSSSYQEGYEQGLQDLRAYEDGFDDGYDGRKCAFPKDPDYMQGYEDGKKDKKRGL